MLLFGDQLGAHKAIAPIESALKKGVFPFFPAPTSSNFEALYEAPFACLRTWAVGRREQSVLDASRTRGIRA